MITPQDINNWLEHPHLLKDVSAQELEQFKDTYPYFNIGLILHTLKTDQNWEKLQLITQVNPVYKAILIAKSENTYQPQQYLGSQITEENVETQQPDADNFTTEAELVTDNTEHQETIATMEQKSSTSLPDDVINGAPIIESIDTVEGTSQKGDIIVTNDALEKIFKDEQIIPDYFAAEGLKIDHQFPEDISSLKKETSNTLNWDDENKPMVVMSFTEWLAFISKKQAKEKAEEESKSALKALWQKEKLAKAIEEESEEIPEEVFEMAVNSILPQDEIISEAMADIYARQNKIEKAIEMYKKLSLQHPEKNTYFAEKIASLQKDI